MKVAAGQGNKIIVPIGYGIIALGIHDKSVLHGCADEIVSGEIGVLCDGSGLAGILDIIAEITPRGAIGDNKYVVKGPTRSIHTPGDQWHHDGDRGQHRQHQREQCVAGLVGADQVVVVVFCDVVVHIHLLQAQQQFLA